jgi:hypothetical protein
VHDRLYTDAKTRAIKENMILDIEEERERCLMQLPHPNVSLHSNMTQSGLDASTRLYYGGMKNLLTKENEINEAKMYLQDLREGDDTFHPEINKISNMIVSSKPRSKSVEQRLIMYGKARNDRQQMMRIAKVDNETADCTFNPRVDKISNQIVTEKSRIIEDSMPRHEYLYGLSKVQNARLDFFRETMQQQNSFTPNINQYPTGTSELLDLPFFDRLNYYEQEKDANHARLQNTYSNGFGEKGNQTIQSGTLFEGHSEIQSEPFHPKTGRSPAGRNMQNMPVGMYLYERGC